MRSALTFLTSILWLLSSAQVESRLLSPLPDQARDDAVGFSIDGIGYVQGGRKADFGISEQLWAYDPSTDSWEARSYLQGIPRQYATSFVLEDQAYLIGGAADPGLRLDEVWRYDPSLDTWTQLSDFPGGERYAMTSFLFQGSAYAGLGKGYDVVYDDLWKYDPIDDSWEEVADFPSALYSAISFHLDGCVYIGSGQDSDDVEIDRIWSFDGERIRPATDLPSVLTATESITVGSTPVLVGGKSQAENAIDGYLLANTRLNAPDGNRVSWVQGSTIAGGEVRNGAVFSIGSKGYYFGGKDGLDVRSNSLIEFSLETDRPEISIFPNPSCLELMIEAEEVFDKVRVYTMEGKLVFSETLEQPTRSIVFSLEDFALGRYLLQAGDHQVKTVFRLCGN